MSRHNNFAGQLREKALDLAEDLKGIGQVFTGAASDKLGSMKESASEKLGELKGQAMEKGRGARDAVNGYVTASPWKSMAIAACVGVFAGWMMRRR